MKYSPMPPVRGYSISMRKGIPLPEGISVSASGTCSISGQPAIWAWSRTNGSNGPQSKQFKDMAPSSRFPRPMCPIRMFCYSNTGKGYIPAFVGMDYRYAREHQVYRQLLYRTVERAGERDLK